MLKLFFLINAVVLFFIVLAGCEERPESPVKGSLTVYADESIFPLIKIEVDTFLVLYPDANIDLHKASAREGIAKIVNGEAELFISSRDLNDEEASAVKHNKLDIQKMKFCYEGIAAITSFETPLYNISYDELKKVLFVGYPELIAVVPERNSGVYEYLKTELLNGSDPGVAEFEENESDVIKHISLNKNKIGFVGYNLLNDSSDVKILNLGLREQGGIKNVYLEPHAGYFVQRLYPLSRTILILLNEVNLGLASGFATFLTGNLGQKIVLENKLGPAAVPVRIIKN